MKTIEILRKIKVLGCDNIFCDLLNVGTEKALGYLPISTIRTYGDDRSISTIMTWAFENNLMFEVYSERESNVGSGALYIWDNKMVEEMIKTHEDILKSADIPTGVNEYVSHIVHTVVPSEKYPEAYVVIGKTFGDKRFKNMSVNECVSEL